MSHKIKFVDPKQEDTETRIELRGRVDEDGDFTVEAFDPAEAKWAMIFFISCETGRGHATYVAEEVLKRGIKTNALGYLQIEN